VKSTPFNENGLFPTFLGLINLKPLEKVRPLNNGNMENKMQP
jgi:hypothetical protein